jgi:hypothetical protein
MVEHHVRKRLETQPVKILLRYFGENLVLALWNTTLRHPEAHYDFNNRKRKLVT